jgi:hypothetical protein
MFCPQCETEYREGFTECADCNIPLVAYLPEKPKPKPDLKLVEILKTRSLDDLRQIQEILEEAKVTYYFQLESRRRAEPIKGRAKILFIEEQDTERVRELLKYLEFEG